MRHYGIPEKIVDIVRSTYCGAKCRVIHQEQLSEAFKVVTGGRQGCLLTPFLFLLIIDWVMRLVTEGKRTGIQWSLLSQLEDLDFANDIALLSHRRKQTQKKTTRLEQIAAQTGLRINSKKKILTRNMEPIKLSSGDVEEVQQFTYLGSIVITDDGTEEDVKARLGKARIAFHMLDSYGNPRSSPDTPS